MKALVSREKDQPLYYGDWPDPQPGEGEVIVRLKAAALNRRDVFVTQGLYPGIVLPIILGSDGAGFLDEREVVINPALGWGDDPLRQAKGFHILGLPKNGTFAEMVAVPRTQIYDKPTYLTWEEAAALPLAGLTAFRALFTKGKLQPGERVLVSGIGGGVALFILQFALAVGAEVWVTSSSGQKIQEAKNLGASGGVNYKDENWNEQLKEMTGGFDLILDSAGGSGFSHFLKLCNTGGRIIVYGGTKGAVPKLSPQVIFWRQISIIGTSMGTDQEFAEMLNFVTRRQIRPIVDSAFTLAEGPAAFERLNKNLQFGKIVFNM